jgi:DNA invertase Pin-like site-specific DNA recombinase
MHNSFSPKNGTANGVKAIRCGIYTRKSTEEGLDQEFNSLHAQREAGEAYIASQKEAGWKALPDHYDDGGFSGGNLDRPALQRLLADIEARRVDCVVVYKVDRLSRSLLDFARVIDRFDQRSVSFVSVTQQFNTTSSLGRLTLNILLSFAQFEREIIGERTRDKMSAARRKGKWVGGTPVLGYDVGPDGGRLVVNEKEARRVREIFGLYQTHRSLLKVLAELGTRRWRNKSWKSKRGIEHVGPAVYADNSAKPAHQRNLRRQGRAPGNDLPWRARGDYRGVTVGRTECGNWYTPTPALGPGSHQPECAAGWAAVLPELRAADDRYLHGQGGTAVSLLRLSGGAPERMGFVSDQVGRGCPDRGYCGGPASHGVER